MCRFVLYLGPPLTLDLLLTRPVHSLVHQSYKAEERREPLNGDGFGLAWYAHEFSAEPAAFRSTQPAWNNQNLHDLCRVTRTSVALAHVRAASPGLPVISTNCHPFTHGPFAFMHNGHVSGFGRLRRELLLGLSDEAFAAVGGTTDSEHMFGLFLDRIGDQTSLEAMAQALDETLTEILRLSREDEPCTLNLAVSNGREAVVARCATGGARPESLYLHEGQCYSLDEDLRCRMQAPQDGLGAVLVSSEPLSEDAGWDPVPPGSLVLIGSEGSTTRRAASIA